MSAYVGKNGTVRDGTTIITLVDSWTLTPAIANADITSYGSTWTSRVSTIRSWTGSFTATLDRSDAVQKAYLLQLETTTTHATKALRLYTTATKYFSGSVFVTGYSVNSNVKDKVNVTVNFKGNGSLASA